MRQVSRRLSRLNSAEYAYGLAPVGRTRRWLYDRGNLNRISPAAATT